MRAKGTGTPYCTHGSTRDARYSPKNNAHVVGPQVFEIFFDIFRKSLVSGQEDGRVAIALRPGASGAAHRLDDGLQRVEGGVGDESALQREQVERWPWLLFKRLGQGRAAAPLLPTSPQHAHTRTPISPSLICPAPPPRPRSNCLFAFFCFIFF